MKTKLLAITLQPFMNITRPPLALHIGGYSRYFIVSLFNDKPLSIAVSGVLTAIVIALQLASRFQ